MQREVCARMLERLEYIKLQPSCLLDMGSGTGWGTRQLAAKYPAAQVIALDIAIGMLQNARSLAVAAFAGGNIDAWSIWDPYLSLAENKTARVIAFSKDVQQSNSFFLANKDFTSKHGDIVALLNKTFAEEGKWATANRSEVAARLQEATGVDKAAVTRAVERSEYNVVPINDKIIATQQETADRFHKLGLIPKPVQVKDIVWTWTPGS